MLAIFAVYGSYTGDDHCYTAYDEECALWRYATIGGFVPKAVSMYAGALAIFFLALTSEWTQWVFATPPFQFLGKISYTLYLIHELFVKWPERDTYDAFKGRGVDDNLAILYVLLIYTPVLILVAWLMEILIDTPAKDFSYSLDIQVRMERPPPPQVLNEETGEMEEQDARNYYSCWGCTKRSWPIYAMIGWLILVVIVTETYCAVRRSNGTYEQAAFADPRSLILDRFHDGGINEGWA